MKDRQRRAMFARMNTYIVYPQHTEKFSRVSGVTVKAHSSHEAIKLVRLTGQKEFPKTARSMRQIHLTAEKVN